MYSFRLCVDPLLFAYSTGAYLLVLRKPFSPHRSHILLILAIVSREQANYAEAEALFRRSLNIRTKLFHVAHPDVGEAVCYKIIGKS